MKRIPLTKGMEALVDDQDYDYLMQWTWHAAKGGKYAARDTRSFDRKHGEIIYMHVVIAQRMGINERVDHENQNGLDNQRHNFRPATRSENGANRGLQVNNISGYKGVCWDCERDKWMAQLKCKGRKVLQKRFDSKIEAAKAYNKAALEHFGEFAVLNEV